MSIDLDNIVFNDKSNCPNEADIMLTLGNVFDLWSSIKDYAKSKNEIYFEEWKYPGKNFGWSLRIKDKRRVIIYLTPKNNSFTVAFVFGEKAFNHIMQSDISHSIKESLSSAKVYAEGRGIRIDIKKSEDGIDIFKLIDFKAMF